jgi:hypothetical protein
VLLALPVLQYQLLQLSKDKQVRFKVKAQGYQQSRVPLHSSMQRCLLWRQLYKSYGNLLRSMSRQLHWYCCYP